MDLLVFFLSFSFPPHRLGNEASLLLFMSAFGSSLLFFYSDGLRAHTPSAGSVSIRLLVFDAVSPLSLLRPTRRPKGKSRPCERALLSFSLPPGFLRTASAINFGPLRIATLLLSSSYFFLPDESAAVKEYPHTPIRRHRLIVASFPPLFLPPSAPSPSSFSAPPQS